MDAVRAELRRLWDEHRSAGFPQSIDKNDERWDQYVVHPVMLDADLAGTIFGVLKGRHGPSVEQRAQLLRGLDELDATNHLVPARAAPYFARLRRMAEIALRCGAR